MRTLAASTQAFLAVCLAAIVTAIVLAIVLPTRSGSTSRQSGPLRVSASALHGPLPTRPTQRPHGIPVAVDIGSRPTGAAIPADFLGLSFRASELRSITGWPQSSDATTLLRSISGGIIRLNGVSVEPHTGSPSAGTGTAAGTSAASEAGAPVTTATLERLASLARRTGWKVLLSVSPIHGDRRGAAEEAAIARQALRGALIGVEISNEGGGRRLEGLHEMSCEGTSAESNDLASALWAIGRIGEAMSELNASGVELRDLLSTPSCSPLAAHGESGLAAGQLTPNPEWYALLLAHRLIGWRPTSVHVLHSPSTAGGPELRAAAFSGAGHEVHVLLEDYGERGSEPLNVHLHIDGSYRGGPMIRLLGPSPTALSGITLAGKAVARDGSWRPHLPVPAVYGHGAHMKVEMPPGSAALLTLLPQHP